MNNHDRITFDQSVNKIGGSHYLLLPPEIVNNLNITTKQTMKVQLENGPHGLYLSAWTPDKDNVDSQHNHTEQ